MNELSVDKMKKLTASNVHDAEGCETSYVFTEEGLTQASVDKNTIYAKEHGGDETATIELFYLTPQVVPDASHN